METQGTTFATVSPATYQQYVKLLIERLVAEQLPELGGVIRVQGKWLAPESSNGKYIYGAKIADDGGAQIKVDIPVSIIASRAILPGQQVIATGRINIRCSNYGVEARLEASDILPAGQEKESQTPRGESMTLEWLKSLPATKNPFPFDGRLKIALIRSVSTLTQVTMDCRAELDQLGDAVNIREIPVNMLDPVDLTQAIESVKDDEMLMMIRGGGDNLEFAVFDDSRVVSAFAKRTSYRVIGLGHTANTTLLDRIAEYAANTPGQAGAYVKHKVLSRLHAIKEKQKEQVALSRLAQERMVMAAELNAMKQKQILQTMMIALVMSLLAGIATYILR